jgi:hypothetical protein
LPVPLAGDVILAPPGPRRTTFGGPWLPWIASVRADVPRAMCSEMPAPAARVKVRWVL